MIDIERIQNAFSSTYWLFTRYEKMPDEPSVVDLLGKELPHIDPASWPRRLAFGGVFINGIGYYENTELPLPCKVEYYEPRFPIEEAHLQYPSFSPEWIVWEDHDLIVTCKPGKLPSMAGKEQRAYNLKTYLETHLQKTLHFPSRLDMSTQGLIIASKSERMHGPVQRLFEKRLIKKEYLFQTASTPAFESVTIDVPIGKSQEHPVLRTPFGDGAKKAITELSVITRSNLIEGDTQSPLTTFVRAQPLTGRTHQIRVHAAHAGVPIIGDNFYGGLKASPLRLLSYALTFIHPFTEEPLRITIPTHLAPLWAIPALSKHS